MEITQESLYEQAKEQIAHFISEKQFNASLDFQMKWSKLDGKKTDVLMILNSALKAQHEKLEKQRVEDGFSGHCYFLEGSIEAFDYCIKEINKIGL